MSWRLLLSVLCLFPFTYISCQNQESEKEAILQQTETFVKAYNRQDSKAMAALWAEDGVYVNPENGVTVQGRKAIEAQYKARFKESKKGQANVEVKSITFPKPDQAIETVIAFVKGANNESNRTVFRARLEKDNGEWLISEVREIYYPFAPTHYDHLKALEWLIGHWVDEDEDGSIELVYEWDKYKNFITQHFTVYTLGQFQIEGIQIIAWDPHKKQIRSWIFDSDGGFGNGVWTKKEDHWIVETDQTLADGSLASAIQIYTPINENSYTWESIGREVGGEILPEIKPVVVVRKKGMEK